MRPATCRLDRPCVAFPDLASERVERRRAGPVRRGDPECSRGQEALLAQVVLAASAVPGLPGLGVVLGLTGLVIAPIYVVAYLAADDTTVPGRRTEAGTWVNVANNAGSAAGAAAAGILADTRGPAQAFLVVGVLLLITAPAVARRRGR